MIITAKRRKDFRAYFVELAPNNQQNNQEDQCFNVKFRAYNISRHYIAHTHRMFVHLKEARNVKTYKKLNNDDKKLAELCFFNWKDYRDWFKKTYIHTKAFHDQWMLDKDNGVSDHTMVRAFHDAGDALARYNKGLSDFPRPKNRNSHHSCYFDGAIHVSRNFLKLPYFTPIKICEPGRVPTDNQLASEGKHVKCVYLSRHAGKTYASVITNEKLPSCLIPRCQLHGHLGIDVGIKSEAIINGINGYKPHWFENVSKTKKYKRLVYHKHVWQRRMARRPKKYYKHQHEYDKKIHEKKAFRPISKRYLRAKYQFRKKCKQISDLTHGYLRKIVFQIIQRKPKSITIEHLNIKGMDKNHHLAKAISKCDWSYFYGWLKWMCKKYGIELRQVSQFYPSTKICCFCHHYNHRQFKGKLSDLSIRTIYCPVYDKYIDRDLNAAINLAHCKKYKVLVPYVL